uniref:Mutator protein n=1 Tax=Hordeum vulgare subsp. vulgare TaxID=112509 RepID=B8K2C0_HORVV|nr:mutator protein [Hordeum vulgare subsp. vulgare]ABE02647.1 mutator protein [Hordeum vulgare subsp. vulgare]
MVWLLNDVYDVEHRAYFMSEKKMELTPLKIRSHGASSVMHYDERYTPYIEMTGLLPFLQLEPEVEDGGKKDRVPAGATFTWIAANFAHCPEDADDEVIQRYAHVYMWYVISRTIFADDTGKNAPWMWLKALTVLDNKFSSGSAALAYLYRQLDDACRRTTKDGGVGGCMLLLSVWSWERLPVGRPKSSQWNTWDDHGNPVRQPTWAYKWDLVSEVASEVNLLYKKYTNEMDSLTPEHPHPPEWVDTDTQLHSNYLRWFQESTRVEICPPAYEEDILEEPTEYDELAQGGYSKLIREGYQTSFAPVLNFVAADDMTLKAFQRSAYMLKPRKEFKRYSPDDYAKGKNPVAGGSRLSRMRSMDDEVEDDDDDESDDPEQFVVARRKKLASKRGRGPK